MGLPILLANRADASTLIENPLIMQQIAVWGPSILLGVWGATLSSAIGSLLGAPRVAQALARDQVLPSWLNWLGRGSGQDDEPRLGTFFTLGVVIAAVCINQLDLIAPVLSMFFLTTYLVLNVAAGIEGFPPKPFFSSCVWRSLELVFAWCDRLFSRDVFNQSYRYSCCCLDCVGNLFLATAQTVRNYLGRC